MIRSLCLGLALTLSLPACAQKAQPAAKATTAAANDADPALWVVKDADTTIYLFGTIHVLKPGLTWFDEAVKAAFDRSGELVLELVMPPEDRMRAIVQAKAAAPAGPTLTEKLPAAKRAAYAKALADMGLPATAFDRMQPWLAATSLSVMPLSKLGYDIAAGPETVLADAAKAEGKPVRGLETAEQQIGYFSTLSQPAQVQFLVSTLDELPDAGPSMAKMVDHWAHGDPDALAKEMNDELKDSPEVEKTLLTDRNARWATWIENRLKAPGTVFVAVGAGHLAGPRSVQSQLAKAGIRATRIAY